MLFQAAVERSAWDAQRPGGLRTIPTVRVERSDDAISFGVLEVSIRLDALRRRRRRRLAFDRQLVGFDRLVLGENGRRDQNMLQLSDVAWKVMATQALDCRPAQALARLAALFGNATEEVIAKQWDVGSPLTQRWKLELHDGETVVEIFA